MGVLLVVYIDIDPMNHCGYDNNEIEIEFHPLSIKVTCKLCIYSHPVVFYCNPAQSTPIFGRLFRRTSFKAKEFKAETLQPTTTGFVINRIENGVAVILTEQDYNHL